MSPETILLIVDGDDSQTTTWGAFATDNAEDEETLELVGALEPGARVSLGGGAAPVVVVERPMAPIELARDVGDIAGRRMLELDDAADVAWLETEFDAMFDRAPNAEEREAFWAKRAETNAECHRIQRGDFPASDYEDVERPEHGWTAQVSA